MKSGRLLFILSLLGLGAAWGLYVFPVLDEETRRNATPRSSASAPSVDTDAIAIATSLEAALRDVPRSPPEGIRGDGDDAFAGTVPWDRVPDFVEWVEGIGRPVSEIEVLSDGIDPTRARCRVVLEGVR